METPGTPNPEQREVASSPELSPIESLPKPGPEIASKPAVAETVNSRKDSANQNQTATLPPLKTQAVQNNTTPKGGVPQASVAGPKDAADDDKIEAEWVQKTELVVGQTKDDPRRQNTELSHLKADYAMKRFGKTIKLPKDV